MGKGLNGNWIEVFRTGRHTDSEGKTKDWTEADLDTIVNKYDPSRHEAPIVVGHPKDNSPAFGWVEGLKRVGQTLYAKLKQVPTEFEDAVREGRYKKRSISLYPDLTLRHIGFLGGKPPAVKGLADIAFNSDDQAVTIEFGDWADRTNASMWRRLRDFFIEKFGLETADQVIPDYNVSALETDAAQPEPSDQGSTSLFKENKEENMDKIQELQDRLTQKENELAQFAEKDKKQQAEIDSLKAQIAKGEAEARRNEFNSFCEQLKNEGKLTPAMIPQVLNFMESLHYAGEYEFAEGDQTVKTPALESFKAFLQSLPKQVEFGEVATNSAAAAGKVDLRDPQAIARAAAEFKEQEQKAGRTISIAEAVKHVTEGGTQ